MLAIYKFISQFIYADNFWRLIYIKSNINSFIDNDFKVKLVSRQTIDLVTGVKNN